MLPFFTNFFFPPLKELYTNWRGCLAIFKGVWKYKLKRSPKSNCITAALFSILRRHYHDRIKNRFQRLDWMLSLKSANDVPVASIKYWHRVWLLDRSFISRCRCLIISWVVSLYVQHLLYSMVWFYTIHLNYCTVQVIYRAITSWLRHDFILYLLARGSDLVSRACSYSVVTRSS